MNRFVSYLAISSITSSLVGWLCAVSLVDVAAASASPKEFSMSSSNLSQLSPPGYDKYHPPSLIDEKPRQVNFTVTIWDIDEVSEKEMSVKYTMTLRMYWHDHRLNLPDLKPGERRTLEPSLLEFIWMPNGQIREGRAFTKPTLIHEPVALRVYPGQLLSISQLTSVHAHCPMDFRFYPMDVQTCEMTLQTYGYTADEVVLDWAKSVKEAVAQISNTASGKFDFVVEADESSTSFTSQGSRKKYSSLKFRIILERRLSFYLMQTYLPSGLLVFLSWLSYFVPPKGNLAARMTLCTVTIMASSTMLASIQTTLPEVSYPKAIDVWMVNCLVFQVLAMVEFCIIIQVSQEQSSSEMKDAEGDEEGASGRPDDNISHKLMSRSADTDSLSTTGDDQTDIGLNTQLPDSSGALDGNRKEAFFTKGLFQQDTGISKRAFALPPIDSIAAPGNKNLFLVDSKQWPSSHAQETLFQESLPAAGSFGVINNTKPLAPIRKRLVATFPDAPHNGGHLKQKLQRNKKPANKDSTGWLLSRCLVVRFFAAAYKIWRRNLHPLDRWATVLIPIAFSGFNVIYWFTYMQQNRRQVF